MVLAVVGVVIVLVVGMQIFNNFESTSRTDFLNEDFSENITCTGAAQSLTHADIVKDTVVLKNATALGTTYSTPGDYNVSSYDDGTILCSTDLNDNAEDDVQVTYNYWGGGQWASAETLYKNTHSSFTVSSTIPLVIFGVGMLTVLGIAFALKRS